MAETQRVPAPRVPFGGRGELAAMGVALVVFVLIAKPWATGSPRATGVALPSVAATAESTVVPEGFAFDQKVFGPFEPKPEWSVWPGGFFVTVLYVTREADDPSHAPTATAPRESPAATAVASQSAPAPVARDWPATVTIGPGDHLLWLGLDTPLEFTVRQVSVWRVGSATDRTTVGVRQLPSTWGPHFTVIGIPVAPESRRLTIWPRGSYDVEVILDPDGSRRSIRIEIQTLDATGTAAP